MTRDCPSPDVMCLAVAPEHIGPRRLGLRAEKCTSGDGLTKPASAWVARAPVHNQLGNRVIRASVANRCLRGRQRLRCIFRTDAPRWPHRAAARHAPAQPLNVPGVDRLRSFGSATSPTALARSRQPQRSRRHVLPSCSSWPSRSSMDSLGRRNCRRSSRTTTAGRNEPPPVTPTPNSQNSRSRSAESAWSLGAVVSGIAPEHVGPRRNAASAGRQLEKCTAGAPTRGGADSPPARESPVGPTDWAPASDYPSRSGHRQAIAGGAFFRASGRGAVARRASAQWVPLT